MERDVEVAARTMLEVAATEAMVRTCDRSHPEFDPLFIWWSVVWPPVGDFSPGASGGLSRRTAAT